MRNNIYRTLSIVLIAAMIIGVSVPADAKKVVKLSAKNVSIKVGEKKTIKVKNSKKKATWTIKSGKKFIKLSKKKKTSVVVSGKNVGKGTVQAKVAGKKLTCKVTVKGKSANKQPGTSGNSTPTPNIAQPKEPTPTPAGNGDDVTPTPASNEGDATPTPAGNGDDVTPTPTGNEGDVTPTPAGNEGGVTPTPNYEPGDIRKEVLVEDFESYPVGYNWESDELKGTSGKATRGMEFVNKNIGRMTVVLDPENADNKCLKIEYTGNTQAYNYAPIFDLDLNKSLEKYSGVMIKSRVVANNTADCMYKTVAAYFSKQGTITPEHYFSTSMTIADAAARGIDRELVKFNVDTSHATGKNETYNVNGGEFDNMTYNNHFFPMFYTDWAMEKIPENRSVGFKETEGDSYKAGWHQNKLGLNFANITEDGVKGSSNISMVIGGTYTGNYQNASVTLYLDDLTFLEDWKPCTSIVLKNTPEKITQGTKVEIAEEDIVYTPANTTETQLTWTSSNERVVTVDDSKSSPVIKALRMGTATITATVTENPSIKASFEIEVIAAIANGQVIDESETYSVTLTELNETTLTSETKRGSTPYDEGFFNKRDGSVSFVSDKNYNSGMSFYINPCTSEDDLVEEGSYFYYEDGAKDVFDYDYIRVKVVSETDLNCRLYDSNGPIAGGAGYPSTNVDVYEDSWIGPAATDDYMEPADDGVGRIIKSDYVSRTLYIPLENVASKCNLANLTAIAIGAQREGCEVIIKSIEFVKVEYDTKVSEITLQSNKEVVENGRTATITATVGPDNAIRKMVKWSSSDERLASVNYNGIVIAAATGTGKVTITATATDGSGVYGEITLWIGDTEETT